METINNLANAASKAVFGEPESKQEPLSGVKGDTAKGEPFDAGNIDPPEDAAAAKLPGDTHTTDSSKPTNPANSTPALGTNNNSSNDATKPASTEDQPPTSSAKDGDVTKSTKAGDQAPAVEGSRQKAEPEGDAPGPKPVAAVAKEHGGDAGNVGKDGEPAKSTDSVDSTSSSSSSESGGPGGLADQKEEDGGIQKESHGEGTGELYVKSSGLKAEGGNFDAAAPGAGREADRLLEQKGVKREPAPATHSHTEEPAADKSVADDKSTDKPSLGQRIKAKLHHSKE